MSDECCRSMTFAELVCYFMAKQGRLNKAVLIEETLPVIKQVASELTGSSEDLTVENLTKIINGSELVSMTQACALAKVLKIPWALANLAMKNSLEKETLELDNHRTLSDLLRSRLRQKKITDPFSLSCLLQGAKVELGITEHVDLDTRTLQKLNFAKVDNIPPDLVLCLGHILNIDIDLWIEATKNTKKQAEYAGFLFR